MLLRQWAESPSDFTFADADMNIQKPTTEDSGTVTIQPPQR
jgi:hypothetical protein